MTEPIRVYSPGQFAGWGPRVWREMLHEVTRSRELIWRFFMRDFSARYRQSVLGVLWAVVLPVVTVGTFLLLNASGLLNVGDTGVPYPVFALLGLTIWQVFAGGLVACANSIVAGGGMVVKINFPKVSLVVAAMGQVVFEVLVRMGLLALAMLLFGVAPKWTVVFFPVSIVPLFLLTMGMGLLLALLNVLLRDVGQVMSVLTSFLLLLTPVVYPATGVLAVVSRYNPIAVLVVGSRDMIITGYFTDPWAFAWASGLAAALFLFAWRVFHLVEPRMAERV